MSANHTPGPWTAECHIHPDGFPFGTVSAGHATVVFVTQNEPEVEANTRLIAAAPELLKALEELRDAPWLNLPGRAGEIIESAISKAKGAA